MGELYSGHRSKPKISRHPNNVSNPPPTDNLASFDIQLFLCNALADLTDLLVIPLPLIIEIEIIAFPSKIDSHSNHLFFFVVFQIYNFR
jgi:hypothetical protein